MHSIRRGSFDVRSIASDGLRRTSLAKLSQLPLEAPITKVLSLLAQVQENCSSDEAKLLDRVMEFLKREGLYSPQMKEIRTEDPVATDLIGALLTVRCHEFPFPISLKPKFNDTSSKDPPIFCRREGVRTIPSSGVVVDPPPVASCSTKPENLHNYPSCSTVPSAGTLKSSSWKNLRRSVPWCA